jgi:adenosylcobinamide-phosphate synthase
MSFFAIVFALLLEQVRPLLLDSQIHRLAWGWARGCARSLDAGRAQHGVLVWVAVVLMPAFLAFIVHLLLISLWEWTGLVLAFTWHVAILYATLGFRQFSHHFTAVRDALDAGDMELARKLLAAWMREPLQQLESLTREALLKTLMDHSVVAAHRHVFAVLGWYAVLAAIGLGPAGAVLYRMSEFASRFFHARSHEDAYSSVYHTTDLGMQAMANSAAHASSSSTHHAAQTAWWWIDYLPARLTAIGFAVVGSFEEVLEAWRGHDHSASHDGLIQSAMTAALNLTGQLQSAHLRNMVGLVWRSVVLWLMLIALLTLAKLIG